MKSQKFTRKDSNVSNKKAAAEAAAPPFCLSFLDWRVCKNISYCFWGNSIRIYAHITYTYCMEMRPFMLNQRMWSVCLSRSRGYHDIVVNWCDSRPGASQHFATHLCVSNQLFCFGWNGLDLKKNTMMNRNKMTQKSARSWYLLRWLRNKVSKTNIPTKNN